MSRRRNKNDNENPDARPMRRTRKPRAGEDARRHGHPGLRHRKGHRPLRPDDAKYYMSELETGHIEANAQVAQSLFKRATNKDKPNVSAAIFWLSAAPSGARTARRRWQKEAREVLSKVAARGTERTGLLQ